MEDHVRLKELYLKPYLFQKNGKLQLMYAGAMLPKAYGLLEAVFRFIAVHKDQFYNLEFHFIGTGKTPYDELGFNIRPLAEKYALWLTIVFKYPICIPYLDVLVHFTNADGIFIIGSPQPHYTPSKTYKCVLSGKPILAVFHKESTAVYLLWSLGEGIVLDFDEEKNVNKIEQEFADHFTNFILFIKSSFSTAIDLNEVQENSATQVTKKLCFFLSKIEN